jgi:uncharacterized membrane protein
MLIVAIHAIAASGVILLGPIQIIRRTKDRKHRFIGRSWVILMYFVCVSGMFIYSLTGSFTIFHALAIWTFVSTTWGVIAIRRGNIRRHIGMMVGSYLGALTAGAFAALVPGRDIPKLAVSDPMLLWSLIAAVIVAATAWAVYVLGFVPTHDKNGERDEARRQSKKSADNEEPAEAGPHPMEGPRTAAGAAG